MTTYTCPDDPTDPEAAALELIVRMPFEVLHCDDYTAILQEFCSLLGVESCFAGLSWADAKPIAAGICFDVTQRHDAADFIRGRARGVLSGTDGMPWVNPEGAAGALNIAAAVLGL